MFIRSCHCQEATTQVWGKTTEIVKGFNQMETKQRDSKWTEVTWLECPLHINVVSIINNLGKKHIQLSVHWSPLAWETANSHGVASCEYHLTVVLPCVGLLVLSVQKWWSRLWVRLNVLKPLSIVFASVLVWEPWFLEQRFGSHSKWWQRQWWDRTQNPKGGSHFRRTWGSFNTQSTKAPIGGVWWCHCSENHIAQPPQQRLLLYVFLRRVGVLDICKLLNFFEDIWLPIWDATESLALEM